MSISSVNIPKQDTNIPEEMFLQAELDAGIHHKNDAFMGLARSLVTALQNYRFKTVMDYGPGTGTYSLAFHEAGFEVVLCEKFEAHRQYIRENLPILHLIDEPITTDLMLFIEVAEHMTDEELAGLFVLIKPKYILFSSTSERTDWDAAWGHINIKEQSEWVAMFERFGYVLERNIGIPTAWAKLFKHGES